jgi:hypothetical protein
MNRLLIFKYENLSRFYQIVKVNTPHGLKEMTLKPHQAITFESSLDSCLEVYSHQSVTTVISDRIPCRELQTSLN